MEKVNRRYPVGIQTFSEIVRGGYVYVDKTDLVWKMAHFAKYIFLSRPRRFGKSLLTSTLESYFRGERELFEGMKIMSLEKEWESYPVLRFDLSGTKHLSPSQVVMELERIMAPMEVLYGSNPKETTPGMRLAGLIQRAYEQTGHQVVVIIDEYDAPLLDLLHEDTTLPEMRKVMQEFYQRLKMCDSFLKFCFITGITKFSQLSIFSTINNLTNITMLPQFSAICGITEGELETVLHEDVESLA
ncbi:MAG: AAA family ATPase, partial [Paludibacteraceae bacterium]|nr:AAA family ATPase [Paludibacteraceae bacterium]